MEIQYIIQTTLYISTSIDSPHRGQWYMYMYLHPNGPAQLRYE